MTEIVLDLDTVTYLWLAFASCNSPPAEPCASEKVALLRILFYGNSRYCISPTVRQQLENIPCETKHQAHQYLGDVVFSSFIPIPDQEAVTARAIALSAFHGGDKNFPDCRIVAECELAHMDVLLSNDTDQIKRLWTTGCSYKIAETIGVLGVLADSSREQDNDRTKPQQSVQQNDIVALVNLAEDYRTVRCGPLGSVLVSVSI